METNQEIMARLQRIESVLQNQENDTAELKRAVYELKSIVQSLDKDKAIQAEKQSHLLSRIEQLQGQINALDSQREKGDDKQRQLIENALMALLGGLIAYIFNLGKIH